MKARWRQREMEGEERRSESHQDLVGLKKKGGGDGVETGNQLLSRRLFFFFFFSPAELAARLNLGGSKSDQDKVRNSF